MKKKNVVNLIRYYIDRDDAGFRAEAKLIAKDFYQSGDEELGMYINGLLSDANYIVPQTADFVSEKLEKYNAGREKEMLLLPGEITSDLLGIMNAVRYHAGINKFLFQGAPGTGKTEGAKKMAELLDRELYYVRFDELIDSKLGQTSKNISSLFQEINTFSHPEKTIVLFDEIDGLVLDRKDSRDLREMGRAATALLKGFDQLNSDIILIATTNLFDRFDKAILRRFDYIVDFNRYSKSDLNDIAVQLLNYYLTVFKIKYRNTRLFQKILNLCDVLPYPGELKNMIRTAIAFSNPDKEGDYLQHIYHAFLKEEPTDASVLKEQKFTLREIEVLTGVSRSTVSRELRRI